VKQAAALAVVALVACFARASAPAAGPLDLAAQERGRGRLFPPQDLGLLEGPDRDQWQKPDLIMDALGIADGSVVADLGAGSGYFTILLAQRVGPNGTVYAQDIQPQMLEAIARRVQRENLDNVRTVLGTETDPRLPPMLDAVLIVGAYHEMNDPAQPDVILTLLGNIMRSLKPQGRVGIVDFLAGAGGPGPAPDERANPDEVIATAKAAGLKLIGSQDVPPFTYLLVFGREAAAPPSNTR
jgi:predicted methyltransferase